MNILLTQRTNFSLETKVTLGQCVCVRQMSLHAPVVASPPVKVTQPRVAPPACVKPQTCVRGSFVSCSPFTTQQTSTVAIASRCKTSSRQMRIFFKQSGGAPDGYETTQITLGCISKRMCPTYRQLSHPFLVKDNISHVSCNKKETKKL